MIEEKFEETGKLFRHTLSISKDGEYGIAHPDIFVEVTDPINIFEDFKQRGYDFLFQVNSSLYFRRRG